jgi:L-ascorbate metabolism protein UlaG (beta-lactamase superfamily)
VDITWLGHAAVRMRTKDATVVMDPADRSAGVDMGRPTGEIVTISHDHPHHSHVAGVKGETTVLDGPGEYEIKGVQIEALRASLRPNGETDAKALRSVIYIFESEEMRLAHLGGLGEPPAAALAEHLGNLDVLFMPVGCPEALPPEQAAKVTRAIEPRIVIPIAYDPPKTGMAKELQAFVEALGVTPEAPVGRASLTRRGLSGETTRVMLLESRG